MTAATMAALKIPDAKALGLAGTEMIEIRNLTIIVIDNNYQNDGYLLHLAVPSSSGACSN
jgi:hypothetical protein